MQKTSINAGELNKRIEIQRRSQASSKTTRGKKQNDFETLSNGRRSAKFETLSGTELEVARDFFGQATLRITLRYFEGLSVQDRISFRGRTIEIGHIDNVNEMNVKHVLLCREIKR